MVRGMEGGVSCNPSDWLLEMDFMEPWRIHT